MADDQMVDPYTGVSLDSSSDYAYPGDYSQGGGDVSGPAGDVDPTSDADSYEYTGNDTSPSGGGYTDEESGAVAGPDLVDSSDVGQPDTWMSGGAGLSGQLQQAMKLGVGGPFGFNLDTGGDNSIMPVPSRGGGRCGGTPSLKTQILCKAAAYIGKRISAKAIVRFIVRWGAAAAAHATGLAANELLALFFDAKGRPHRRRGPHLYTVVKRIRQGHRYQKMLARYAHKTHSVQHRAAARPFYPRHRARARRR